MMILPPEANDENRTRNFDDKLLKAFAKAYKWKTIIEEEGSKIRSLSDLARSENISMSHATKIYRLNFISPKIIEHIVNLLNFTPCKHYSPTGAWLNTS